MGTTVGTSPNRLIGVIFGAIYLLVGLLGFSVTGNVAFVGANGGLLLGVFEVNPLHNVAHLIIGAALLIAGLSSVMAAKTVNIIVGFVYLVLGIIGFFLVGTAFNILALNAPDHFLHLGTAIILLIVGFAADRMMPKNTNMSNA